MDSAVSLKYLKAVQQLEQKTLELDSVFDEARRLEQQNQSLVAENEVLRERVSNLEQKLARTSEERSALVTQVNSLQARVQEFIDKEISDLQAQQRLNHERTTTTKAEAQENQSLIRQLQQERDELDILLRKSEEAWQIASRRAEEAFTSQLDMKASHERLTAEREKLRAQVSRLQAQQRTLESESRAMEDIESRALEGLRAELSSLTAENDKLVDMLDAEKSAHAASHAELHKLEQLLMRQREVSESQAVIAKEEIHALNMQNEALLRDVQELVKQRAAATTSIARRDHQENDVTSHRNVDRWAAQSHSSSRSSSGAKLNNRGPLPARGAVPTKQTVNRGVMTTAVFDFSPLPSSVSPTPVASRGGPHVEAERPRPDLPRIEELTSTVQQLSSRVEKQQGIIKEKVANERLLEEKASLLQQERNHLNDAVLHARETIRSLEKQLEILQAEAAEQQPKAACSIAKEPPQQVPSEASQKNASTTDVDLAVVLEAITDSLLYFVQVEAELCMSVSESSSTLSPVASFVGGAEDGVIPIVPCKAFRSALMNSIFEQLGGLRHVGKRVEKSTEVIRLLRQHYRQQTQQLQRIRSSLGEPSGIQRMSPAHILSPHTSPTPTRANEGEFAQREDAILRTPSAHPAVSGSAATDQKGGERPSEGVTCGGGRFPPASAHNSSTVASALTAYMQTLQASHAQWGSLAQISARKGETPPSSPPDNRSEARQLYTWADTRRQHHQVNAEAQHASSGKKGSAQEPRAASTLLHPQSNYRAGETLLEALEQLRYSPGIRSRSRRRSVTPNASSAKELGIAAQNAVQRPSRNPRNVTSPSSHDGQRRLEYLRQRIALMEQCED